jgi:hypothetical protein
MVTTSLPVIDFTVPTGPIDCACVIHGQVYSWDYVERLHSMLARHITPGVRLHVYTEANRGVPDTMIKHALPDWSISGPKKSWWYKLQVFNPEHHQGPLLYFDLDTVITQNIDWIWQSSLQHFWTVRDFKYLWRPTNYTVNTSIMWFNTVRFAHVYRDFVTQNIMQLMRRYHGDQDYITEVIPQDQRRFLNTEQVKSWRWQTLDGGYNFNNRKYHNPGAGTQLTDKTSVLIFHGKPKPAEIHDPVIIQHWQ